MQNKETQPCCEKFKTMIGGQALIEGIMMRGPKKDAIVIRGKDGLTVEVSDRKLFPDGSFKKWPFFRGVFNFFDSQVTGVKALMPSSSSAPKTVKACTQAKKSGPSSCASPSSVRKERSWPAIPTLL